MIAPGKCTKRHRRNNPRTSRPIRLPRTATAKAAMSRVKWVRHRAGPSALPATNQNKSRQMGWFTPGPTRTALTPQLKTRASTSTMPSTRTTAGRTRQTAAHTITAQHQSARCRVIILTCHRRFRGHLINRARDVPPPARLRNQHRTTHSRGITHLRVSRRATFTASSATTAGVPTAPPGMMCMPAKATCQAQCKTDTLNHQS